MRRRYRARLARHENLFALAWYLHLVRNEDPGAQAAAVVQRADRCTLADEPDRTAPLRPYVRTEGPAA